MTEIQFYTVYFLRIYIFNNEHIICHCLFKATTAHTELRIQTWNALFITV